MIALIVAGVLLFSIALTLVRMFSGPTLYDRALAAVSAILKTALLCAAIAAASNAALWLDVALVLALSALALGAVVLKFFRVRSFQPPMPRGA